MLLQLNRIGYAVILRSATHTMGNWHIYIATFARNNTISKLCIYYLYAYRYTPILQKKTGWADTYTNTPCNIHVKKIYLLKNTLQHISKHHVNFLSMLQIHICSMQSLFCINIMRGRKLSLLLKSPDVKKMWSLPDFQSSPCLSSQTDRCLD